MRSWTTVYVPEDIDDDRLARAFGAALAVDPATVAVVSGPGVAALNAAADPAIQVFVQRDRVDAEEPHFPYGLDVGSRPAVSPMTDGETGVLRALARELESPVVAAIDPDDQDTWHLARPDGSWVAIEVDDDSNFVLDPADRSALARYLPTVTPVAR